MNFVADPVIVECTLNTIALEGHGQCPGSPFEVLHWLFKCFALIYCIILVRVASTALKSQRTLEGRLGAAYPPPYADDQRNP